MSLVVVQDLSLSYGKKVLFEDTSFAIGAQDRVGLVGANGTGKSTLLKLLVGQQAPDRGAIRLMSKARHGYLPQELSGLPTGTVVDSVLCAVPGRETLEGRLAGTEAALATATEEAEQLELAQTLADLHQELEHFEERYGRHQAERILAGLGFTARDLEKPTSALSGGWRMRAALAGLLLQDPDLLLLDEPTNHLDLPTLTWFDGFLKRSRKALVLISHDRDFLNRQIGRVVSLEVEGLRSYTGNYEDYRRQRAQELEQLTAKAERQADRRAQMEAFIERFGAKASKARQAQSRAKMLEKEEVIEVHQERKKVSFTFPEALRSGRDVVKLEGISKRYGQTVVYEGLSATVERGQRVAVVGANGAGKTTLLKLVAGELSPDSGSSAMGHNVVLGYYAQHHAETLDRSATILDEVKKLVPDKPQSYVRSVLGAFLFSGDDVDKPIGVLSGGERARVALAKLLLVPANFLVMDEPTNHLDLDSAEALIEALREYTGTLLFVSHNRSFLNQLATHVWDVRDHRAIPFPGNLDEYLHHLELVTADADGGASGSGDAKPVAGKPLTEKERKRQEAEERNRRSAVEGPIKKEIAALEQKISALEAEQKARETQLADAGFYNDFPKAKPVMDAHREGAQALEALYAQWESAQERLAAAGRSA